MNLPRALASVGGLTMLSRVLGVIRDICIAAVFRVGMVTDAFFIAFALPNMLRRLTAEGALTQAFVPVFVERKTRQGDAAAKQLGSDAASALFFALLLLTLAGVISAPLIIALVAPGFADVEGKSELAAALLRVTFPYILFISLTALMSGILNAHGRFAAPAAAPALLNVAMIFAVVIVAPYLEKQNAIFALAGGVFVGGVLQLALQCAAAAKIGMLPRLRMRRPSADVRRVVKLAAQGALGVSVAQLSLIINKVFASYLAEGSVSWLYYADRLMELPAGLLGAALAVIILPPLSRCFAKADSAGAIAVMDWALRVAALFALPAACALVVLSLPLTATLFKFGAFSAMDAQMTARALSAYGVGVVGLVLVRILAAGFYARQNIAAPVKIAVLTLAATQVMNILFIFGLEMAHAGLTLSIGLAACLNSALLLRGLRKSGVYRPLAGWTLYLGKVVFASALMCAALLFADAPSAFWLSADWQTRAFALARLVLLGGGVYFGTLFVLGFRPSHLLAPQDSV
jgi:putative peptidoglycan lipid II flippase